MSTMRLGGLCLAGAVVLAGLQGCGASDGAPSPANTDLAVCEAGAKQLGLEGGVLLVVPTIAVSGEGRAVIGCTVHKLSTDAWVLFEVDRGTGEATIDAGS